jgi:hypothetical protein
MTSFQSNKPDLLNCTILSTRSCCNLAGNIHVVMMMTICTEFCVCAVVSLMWREDIIKSKNTQSTQSSTFDCCKKI